MAPRIDARGGVATMNVYQTASIAEKGQFDYWHDVICRHFVPADSRVDRARSFQATFSTDSLGPYQISRLAAPHHMWTRTSENLRRGPHDEFLLSLKLSGTARLGQGGREVEQDAGELALYDTGRQFSYLLDSDIVLLKIPRREIEARLPGVARYTAVGFGRSSPVGRLAARLVQDTLDLGLQSTEVAAQRMGDCVVDAVAAAIEFEVAGTVRRPSPETALLESVKRFILSNLGDRSLDVSGIASHHGVSVRTLNRLFSLEGTTPMRWVWVQRLAACRSAIESGSDYRITDIAYDNGFADPSHFCRAFKTAYGMRPMDAAKIRGK